MFPQIKVTEAQIGKAKPKDKPYKLSIGGSLHILVHPNGGKYWRYRYRFLGKEKTLSIGLFPQISMKEAIVCRDNAKTMLSEGIDPSATKKEAAKNKPKPAHLKAQFSMRMSEDGNFTIETDKKIITLTALQFQALRSFVAALPNTEEV